MNRIIVKLNKDDLEWLLHDGKVRFDVTVHNYDNLQCVDIELDQYDSSIDYKED